MTGIVFDIKEFAINDGPGIRLTVFLKGCPLRCQWCHNPEGLSREPQKNLLTGRIVGTEWNDSDLAAHCARFKLCYAITGGGVTFSGGEATAQSEFLMATASRLQAEGIHVNLDTSGYCDPKTFAAVLQHVDMAYYDLKCMDPVLHKKMTGVDNALILENLRAVATSKVAYHIRVPLVPGVSDTAVNRKATVDFVNALPRGPEAIDWLPFNDLAAGKYPAYGMTFPFKGGCGDE